MKKTFAENNVQRYDDDLSEHENKKSCNTIKGYRKLLWISD